MRGLDRSATTVSNVHFRGFWMSYIAIAMDQGASSAGKVVLLDNGDLEACLC